MRLLLVIPIAAALVACGKDVTAPVALDRHGCDFVKRAVWQAAGNALPVPDALMSSTSWDLPAPWYLGIETTTFTPTLSAANTESCTVVNR